jgi:subtilisin family serine protease
MRKRTSSALLVLAAFAGLVCASSALAGGTTPAASGRYLVIAKSGADMNAVRSAVVGAGTKVVLSLPQINTLVVTQAQQTPGALGSIRANANVETVVPDRIETLVRPTLKQELFGPSQQRILVKGPNVVGAPTPDPAFELPGLMWNFSRIAAFSAWKKTTGGSDVLVGVADTGLDYTHADLGSQIADVQDFTTNEEPVICDPSDAQVASDLGAPAANLDFNGHGSWIGGNIAGALNGTGVNGIAPGVKLVALKISGWCGSAYDSTILEAFIWAADHGIDVVSISFGGYLDLSDPAQDAVYKLYKATVNYARSLGTVIAASAGNEHTRIGDGGQVISHGILDVPPGGTDFYGLYQVPGGIPGVVDVAATGNVVKAPSASCPADSLAAGSHQWCKPESDPHQPFGVGLRNQLTYYSNYGPRIDVAAPGGARRFNLPNIDRGGTEGWPWTGTDSVFGGTSEKDGFNAWEAFSTTSNWALEIPCFTFTGSSIFPDGQCYSIIQGTSMAAPHASATLALIASAHPNIRHKPNKLIDKLKSSAQPMTGNTTPGVSATDTSPGDAGTGPCPGGYCHLGGAPISDADAYGAGLVNEGAAVR